MDYAVLVVNGGIKDFSFYKKILDEASLIVASDGAADIMRGYNQKLDYVIGDMDSISVDTLNYYKTNNTVMLTYPVKKDKTDSQLCIDIIKKKNLKKIIMIGALGDRIDHFLSNINLMYYADNIGLTLEIVDENNEISLLNKKENYMKCEINQTISFASVSGDVNGITLEGFEYELSNYDLPFGSSILTSNIARKSEVFVGIEKGSLVCIKISKG